ncbi:MAG TPA: hypothetical protein VET48_07260, partial [Steroidobacteraceae bacterium]|nr:hypothetical protein [Steroidobacteraceae bacterium]
MGFFAEHRRFIVVSVIASMAAITLGVVTWSAKQEADQLLVEKQNLQQAQSELQAKQAELEKSILRAKREAQASDDAVKDSQQYQQEQRARANRARGLINGMSAATSMKTAMTEFYFTEGKWPSSNQEFGEPDPSGFNADGVQSINVLPGGKIRLVLIGEAG